MEQKLRLVIQSKKRTEQTQEKAKMEQRSSIEPVQSKSGG